MPKDTILTESFFSMHEDIIINEAQHEELNDYERLIKYKLYSHLSETESPTYYQGSFTLPALIEFSYKKGTTLPSDDFIMLQQEFAQILFSIKSFALKHQIYGSESLSAFLKNINKPSDGSGIIYRDGKKSLETIAILLLDSRITLENRKKVLTHLLADKELEHCIAGCYSRIVSALSQLEQYLHNRNQVKHWLLAYANDMASYQAAKRPFACPYTYQELICKASDSGLPQNMLHANNFLLMEAKKHDFPIHMTIDSGALEIERGLSPLSKETIVKLYIQDLDEEITAANLVHYLSEKFYASFILTMSSDADYSVKVDIILTQLNLLGEDSWFRSNKNSLLEEIIEENGNLKSGDYLKTTIIERLLSRNLLQCEEINNLRLLGKTIFYRKFPLAVELTWISVNGERKSLLKLIEEDRLPDLIPLLPNFIENSAGLLKIIKSMPASRLDAFLNVMTLQSMVGIIKKSHSVNDFMDLFSYLEGRESKANFIQRCGHEFISRMVQDNIINVDIETLFHGVPIEYFKKDHTLISKREALHVTKELIKLIIQNGFKDFTQISFVSLSHIKYLNRIDFSGIDFTGANFFQEIENTMFNAAILKNVKFWKILKNVSFRNTDLTEVIFHTNVNEKYGAIDLHNARLSTKSFLSLRSAGNTDFSAADMQEVDFQNRRVRPDLQSLDFSDANLYGVDLSNIKLDTTILFGTNLGKSDLRGISIPQLINDRTNFKESHLDFSTLSALNQKNLQSFEQCKIYLNTDISDVFYFSKVNFNGAIFYGEILQANFIECDLRKSMFNPNNAVDVENNNPSHMILYIKSKNSQWDETVFRQLSFVEGTYFKESTIQNIVLDHVEMPGSLLFEFYKGGHRNFNGVEDLRGHISQDFLPFPVLDANLNKKVFLYLYRQGLRDFRGSSLNSFYLGQALIEQAITEINLKLEGAKYKSSPIGCNSRNRRETGISSCIVYFLVKKNSHSVTRSMSASDIELLEHLDITIPHHFLFKEISSGHPPLYYFSHVNEIHIFWTDTESSVITSARLIQSMVDTQQRSTLAVHFYFFYESQNTLKFMESADYLRKIGFSNVVYHYFSEQREYSKIQLKNNHILSIAVTVANTQFIQKFRILTKNFKVHPSEMFEIEKNRAYLRRITLDVKKKMVLNRRPVGQRESGYEIGAAIIYLIGEAINKPSKPKIVALDEERKTALKILARNFSHQIGQERGADPRQIETITRLAVRCIDQLECSNEELVAKDVVDSMERTRPDLMLGNEYFFNKTKVFFINIGYYFSEKFNNLSAAFRSNELLEAESGSMHWLPPQLYTLNRRNRHRIQKRGFYHLYESPILINLIKDIELTFSAMGLSRPWNILFSEKNIVNFLFRLWQTLDLQGVTQDTSEESILSFLSNNVTWQMLNNLEEKLLNTKWEGGVNTSSLNLSYPIAFSRSIRQKRANLFYVSPANKRDVNGSTSLSCCVYWPPSFLMRASTEALLGILSGLGAMITPLFFRPLKYYLVLRLNDHSGCVNIIVNIADLITTCLVNAAINSLRFLSVDLSFTGSQNECGNRPNIFSVKDYFISAMFSTLGMRILISGIQYLVDTRIRNKWVMPMINLVLYLQGLVMLLCMEEKYEDNKFHLLGGGIVHTLACIFSVSSADAVINAYVNRQPDGSRKSAPPSTEPAAESNSSFFRLQKPKRRDKESTKCEVKEPAIGVR